MRMIVDVPHPNESCLSARESSTPVFTTASFARSADRWANLNLRPPLGSKLSAWRPGVCDTMATFRRTFGSRNMGTDLARGAIK